VIRLALGDEEKQAPGRGGCVGLHSFGARADSDPRCLVLQRKRNSQNTTLALANGIGRFARTCGLTALTRRLHELFGT
jgi:hypothetical protein